MKKILFPLLLVLVASFAVSAQSRITLEEVKQHMGDSVTVCGKVFGTRFLEYANGQPTLMNMGGFYPNELITVVIYGADRKKFKVKPEEFFLSKNICVTGRIAAFKGKSQMVVTMPEQVLLQ